MKVHVNSALVLAAFLLVSSHAFADVIAGPFTNPANGHLYFLLDQQSWSNSESEAVDLGGHLATINDAKENNWVWDTFVHLVESPNDQGNLWIGFTDRESEGTFEWVSDEIVTFTNWSPGEPNNLNNEDYAHMTGTGFVGHAPRTWNDILDSGMGGGGLVTPPYGVVEVRGATAVSPGTWGCIKLLIFTSAEGKTYAQD